VEGRVMLAADSGYGGSVDASDRGYQMSRIACIKETKNVTVLGRRNWFHVGMGVEVHSWRLVFIL